MVAGHLGSGKWISNIVLNGAALESCNSQQRAVITLGENRQCGTCFQFLKCSLALTIAEKDEDPVIFYQAIARLGQERLSMQGAVYAEIHEDLAGLVVGIFKGAGYQDITVRKDMQGKDRMVKATR